MDSNRFRRAQELFEKAVALDPGQREPFLLDRCSDDPELLDRVMRMVAYDRDRAATAGLLAGVGPTRDPAGTAAPDPVGAMIGHYRIETLLGEGGFGSVYLAQQQAPVSRAVALKLVRPGRDGSRMIERFETERQVLAMMDHPNIARVFDAGTSDESLGARPYVVMELVRGAPITTYCNDRRLTPRERLELFLPVCRAVHHAHQKAIIHRDIKPSNVLVETHDDRPVPKVIDFGIAKALDETALEGAPAFDDRQPVGTPRYMSPEQAERGRGVDIRSDVYSLGALLYELLTGVTPFDDDQFGGATYAEIEQVICRESPPSPSTRLSGLGDELGEIARQRRTEPRRLDRLLRGDLDWIVMKALAREPESRYDSTLELASDIERHLRREAVLAAPPGASYRLGRLLARHRVGFGAAAVVALSLLVGATFGLVGLVQARGERNDAIEARAEAVADRDAAEALTRFLAGILAATEGRGPDVTVREVLDDASLTVETAFGDRPYREARLRQTIGSSYYGLGLLEEAESHLERALELYRRELGDGDALTLRTAQGLGFVYKFQARLEDAESIYHWALEQMHDRPEHPLRGSLLNNLAAVYTSQSRYDEAEPLLNELLDQRRRTGAPDGEVANTMAELARLHGVRGEYQEAEALLAEAVELRRAALGEDDRNALLMMHNLATFRVRLGRYDEVEPQIEQLIEQMTRVLGEEHPATLSAAVNLCTLYSAQGRHEESMPLLRRTLTGLRRAFGPEHPSTLAAQVNLANSCMDLENLDEAESLLADTLPVQRRTLGDDHHQTLTTLENLAAVHIRRGRLAEAEPVIREVVEARRRAQGADHAATLFALTTLADVLHQLGRYDEAEVTFRESIEAHERAYGPDNLRRLETVSALAGHYVELQRPEEAEPLLREALERRMRLHGPAHEDTLSTTCDLDRVAILLGRFEEAEPSCLDTLERVERSMPEGHHLLGVAWTNLGRCRTGLGAFEDAEAALLTAREILVAALGEEDSRTVTAAIMLARLYEDWGLPDAAEEWREVAGGTSSSGR